MQFSNKNIILNLSVYGISHAVIDASCAALVFSLLTFSRVSFDFFILLAVVYNIVAFGTQPFFGLLFDKIKKPKSAAIFGSFLMIAALVLSLKYSILAVIAAGFANALFHVGGGSISLNLIKEKATAPAIFVAPGALGLLIGTLIGRSQNFSIWPLIFAVSACIILMFYLKSPQMNYKTAKKNKSNYVELIIIVLFLVVVSRSFIGTVTTFPWKSNLALLVLLTCAVVLGKAFGGILGDRYGWTKVAVTSLIISAPLLAFGSSIPLLAILGMFLFNITMPITLVAISNTLPGRPGFSFGITTLALILGVIPTYLAPGIIFGSSMVIFITVLISALILYYGLSLYFKLRKL